MSEFTNKPEFLTVCGDVTESRICAIKTQSAFVAAVLALAERESVKVGTAYDLLCDYDLVAKLVARRSTDAVLSLLVGSPMDLSYTDLAVFWSDQEPKTGLFANHFDSDFLAYVEIDFAPAPRKVIRSAVVEIATS